MLWLTNVYAVHLKHLNYSDGVYGEQTHIPRFKKQHIVFFFLFYFTRTEKMSRVMFMEPSKLKANKKYDWLMLGSHCAIFGPF